MRVLKGSALIVCFGLSVIIVLNVVVLVVMIGIGHLIDVITMPRRVEMHMLAAEAQRHRQRAGHRGQHEIHSQKNEG